MVVENSLQAGFGEHGAGHRFGAGSENLPLGRAQTVLAEVIRPARWVRVGHSAVVVGQDEIRGGIGGDRGEQPGGLDGDGDAVGESGGLFEGDGHKGAKHDQAALGQLVAQRRRVGRHVAPIAEFGAGIAGFGEFIQHAAEADLLRRQSLRIRECPRNKGRFQQEAWA